MRNLVNAKMVLLFVCIFALSMALLPGFVTKVMAENLPAGSTMVAAAGDAGSLGGNATLAGVSGGTLLLIGVVAAAGVILLLSANDDNDTTTNH